MGKRIGGILAGSGGLHPSSTMDLPIGRARPNFARHERRFAFMPVAGPDSPPNLATHQKIIDAAVGDLFVTEAAQYEIVVGTLDQDSWTQQGMSERSTAAHGMMPPWFWHFWPFAGGPNPARSAELRKAKIITELARTAELIDLRKWPDARHLFGMLTHTAQDMHAHAHTLGGEGDVPLPWNLFDPFSHVDSDQHERMGTANVNAAIKETRKSFEKLETGFLELPPLPTLATTPNLDKHLKFLRFRGFEAYEKGFNYKQRLAEDRARWQEQASKSQ